MVRASACVAAVGLLLVATSASSQRADGSREGETWPHIGGDFTNARYSALGEVSAATVASLAGAWQSVEFDDGAQSRATPVVADGLMFVTAGPSVYAFDARTGASVWRARPDERPMAEGSNLLSAGAQSQVLMTDRKLPSASGVAVGGGLVFAGLTGGEVVALDARTGKHVWARQIGDTPPPRGQAVSAVPVYADGRLFTGLANGDFAIRGRIVALDATTGRELWRFYTVPGPGEPGHQTWQQDNDYWKRGGAGVWLVAAVDRALGLIYFVTGNPVPMVGGEVRAGDNLYTASVLALETGTGRLRWHFQLVHHDIWDADAGVAPILFDAPFGERMRKGIGVFRSDGDLFLLDRETGEALVPIEERPVPQDSTVKTARTQPFTVGAEPWLPSCDEWKKLVTPPDGLTVGCQYAPLSFDSNVLAPGFRVRVAPASYSRQTGYFYVAGGTSLVLRRRVSRDPYFVQIAGRPVPGVSRVATVLAAIDGRTARVAWKRELPTGSVGRSGMFTTAGGLLFYSTSDGTLEASDARTGRRLWQFRTGAPGGTGPLASFALDGRQYLAVAAGRRVWTFRVGGSVPEVSGPPARTGGDGAASAAQGPIDDFNGAIEDATEIETASLLTDGGIIGRRYAVDEHTFRPTRARARAGTRVTFINNGTIAHTISARDGSWTTGLLTPGSRASITLDKAGSYVYRCTEHPWAIGQVIAQ